LIKGVHDNGISGSNGIAFMKAGDDPYVVGLGPFEEFSQAPRSGTAFYCNDFTLEDPRPWKVASEVLEVESLAEVGYMPTSVEVE